MPTVPRSSRGWKVLAERLGRAIPRERLHPAVLEWTRTSPGRARWLVAFSGGADSVALLLLLWTHWPEHRARLSAVHFDHRLRGRASTDDERFCRRVCAGLGVRYVSGRWDMATTGASEAEARAARHAFFRRELLRQRARALWFGHQQDDIAETLFMRLARGSGPAGLAAPRPVQRLVGGQIHLRPLLSLKKEELVRALRQTSVPWREDATNATRAFLRNRMRHDVLPAWRAAAGERDALAGAALSRELIEEDSEALDAWLAEVAPITRTGRLALRRLAGKPRALVRRALQRWLGEYGGAPRLSRQAFAALLDDAQRGRTTRHSIGVESFAVIDRRHIRLVSAKRKNAL